jgi:hypothetical protein
MTAEFYTPLAEIAKVVPARMPEGAAFGFTVQPVPLWPYPAYTSPARNRSIRLPVFPVRVVFVILCYFALVRAHISRSKT